MSESSPPEPSVLAVADSADLPRSLRRDDRRVIAEPSAEAGLRRLETDDIDAVVSAYRLPGSDGLDFLRAVRSEHPSLPFVLSVTEGSEALASEAIRAGATDYVPRTETDRDGEEDIGLGNDRGRTNETLSDRVDALLNATDGGMTVRRDDRPAGPDDGPVASALQLKERAMDEAPVGITISDATAPDYPLIYVNDAFERITGYRRTEALGHNCRFLQGERSDPEAIAEMRAAIDEHRPTSVEIVNYRKDGTPFWNQVDIAPIRDDGTVTHYVGFQTDVTDRKRAEREVERKADALAKERASLERLLDRIKGLIHETTGALVTASTREEVERVVVEEIAAATPYALAWIGEPDPADETIAPRTWAGNGATEHLATRFESTEAIDLGTDVARDSALATAVIERRTRVDVDPTLPIAARTRDDGPRDRSTAEGTGPQSTADDPDPDPATDDSSVPSDESGAANRHEGRTTEEGDPDALGRENGRRDATPGALDAGIENVGPRDAREVVGTGAAIPIAYRDVLYGVLCVYTEPGYGIDERELAVLDALSNATATTINALESKRVLTAEDVVELEFEITDEDLFFAAISARADCALEHAGSIHAADGSLSTFVTCKGAAAERIHEIAADSPEIDDARLVTEREDACLFEFTVAEPSLASVLADHGARTREITAEAGVCRLCVELPRERDARSVADALDERYGTAELVSYHERERPARTAGEFLDAVEERLTDRQLTALRTAYLSGFFEWPRPVSGDELGASMDISRSTFHQHLRAAERKLFDVFFDR